MGLAEGFRTGMAFAELRERRERQAQTNADNAMDSWAAVSAAMTPAVARDESNFEINIMETTMQNLTNFTRSIEADKNQSIQADRLIKELENTFGAALPETIRDTLKKGKKDDLSDMVEHLNFESIAQSYGLEMFKNIFTDANAFAEMEKRQLTSRGNRTLDNPSARKKLRNLKLRQRKYMEVSNKVLQGMRDRAQEIENTYGKTPSLTAYADYFRERTERMDQFNQRIDAVEKEIRAPEAAAATAFAQVPAALAKARAEIPIKAEEQRVLGQIRSEQQVETAAATTSANLRAKYEQIARDTGRPVAEVMEIGEGLRRTTSERMGLAILGAGLDRAPQTPKQAKDVAKMYREMFGTEDFLSQILGGVLKKPEEESESGKPKSPQERLEELQGRTR